MAQETTKTRDADVPEGEVPQGALPGQITSPNPVEVFWEKHKVKVWIGVAIAGLIYGGMRFLEYQKRLARNETWTRVTSATGLAGQLQPSDFPASSPFGPQFAATIKAQWQFERFGKAIEDANVDELRQAADATDDKSGKAIVLWFLARRFAFDGEVAKTKSTIAEIEKLDPKFPAFVEREAPPVYIEIPEVDKDDPKSKKLAEDPPLPAAAKLSDRLIAMAERQATFKAEHKDLYTPPTPAEKPVVRMETSEGEIVIRFYPEQAPKHVANFVENCKKGVYKDMSFHRIVRKGTGATADFLFRGGELAFFGDPESKQDDRTKWGNFKSEKQIEDELSGISHFPFMLAADRDATKKGSDTQLAYFTSSDSADRDDGYVVFGRVVEGQDVIRSIVSKPLNSAQETESGTGVPATSITIIKVSVEE